MALHEEEHGQVGQRGNHDQQAADHGLDDELAQDAHQAVVVAALLRAAVLAHFDVVLPFALEDPLRPAATAAGVGSVVVELKQRPEQANEEPGEADVDDDVEG